MSRLDRARQLERALGEAPERDVVMALAAFAGLLLDANLNWRSAGVDVAAVALAAATALPLVVRRGHPLGVLVVVTAGLLACLAVFHPNNAAVAVVMLAIFTVGLQGRRLRSLLVGAAMAPVVAAAVVITSDANLEPGPTLARLALLLAALAAGDAWRGRRALMQAAAEETRREQDAAAIHRFDEERLRLAHELHDTVAHTLVGINTRAAAAVHLQRRGADENFDALEEIRRSSADALAELRSTLKVLRPAAGDAPLRPAQSLADLQELVDGVGGAGLDIDLQLTANPLQLPTATAHGAYRIVQESLTNVLRHASATHALVRVALVDDLLTVEVLDDGHAPGHDHATPGQGLQGMAERAAALGGRCEAGAAAGGGWRVRASLPARMAHA
ncbi:MAG TPA: histidine kinase [Solirubrobacteraceae bacterium]|jgi:signal transduction histidine kinase|nr:histidine kinase [Solirubrobacteraceae bacterium]